MVITRLYLYYRYYIQVVSGASLAEVASVVIEHIRFPLLDPDTLNTVEKENTKNYLIPVSNCRRVEINVLFAYSSLSSQYIINN